jgi:hypothetical protein
MKTICFAKKRGFFTTFQNFRVILSESEIQNLKKDLPV